jgi:hypothetical protein
MNRLGDIATGRRPESLIRASSSLSNVKMYAAPTAVAAAMTCASFSPAIPAKRRHSISGMGGSGAMINGVTSSRWWYAASASAPNLRRMLRSASTRTGSDTAARNNSRRHKARRNAEPPVGEPEAAMRQDASKNKRVARLILIGAWRRRKTRNAGRSSLLPNRVRPRR